MAATVDVRWLGSEGLVQGTLANIAQAVEATCAWIDVLDPDEESLRVLAEHFDLHPLAIEDCLHFPQRPKLDLYSGSLFLVWLGVSQNSEGVENSELDIFLGNRWVITVHPHPLPALDAITLEADMHLARGADWLLHAIVDRMVDGVFPVIDELGDRLDRLQDAMLERTERSQLEELYDLRRELLFMHKTVAPERDSLRALVREREIVSEEAYRYFQDVADHLARVEDSIDTYREVAAAVMDVYLSAQSNRMNAIMKQLTIMATIFMPLTLITGIYGMNFKHLPELGWRYGYFGVLASMVAISVAMLVFFKRREWW